MPETATVHVSTVVVREIARFLAATRRRSERDLYLGKRAYRRHYRSWPLLVTSLRPQSEGDVSAALCNASEDGLAFRCARCFQVGHVLAVKLFWHDPTSGRVPVVVIHHETDGDIAVVGCAFILDDASLIERAIRVRPAWYEA